MQLFGHKPSLPISVKQQWMERRLRVKMHYIATAVYPLCVYETLRYTAVIMDHLSTSLILHFLSLFAATVNWCNLRGLTSTMQRDARTATHNAHVYGPDAAGCTGNTGPGVRIAYFGISEQVRWFLQLKPVVGEALVLWFDFRCSLPC